MKPIISSFIRRLLPTVMFLSLTLSVAAEDLPKYKLVVKSTPEMAATFNADSLNLPAGEEIQLHAFTNGKFTFKEWIDAEDGNVVSSEQSFTFAMPAKNMSLNAVFEYNPANPANPETNYWNPEAGEIIVDDFTPGSLLRAINNAIDESGDYSDVTSITVAGVMNDNDWGIANNYYSCTLLDLSRVTGVTAVPSYAFDYSNLATVYLPATIEKIGSWAFADCASLTSLVCYALTPPTLGSNVFSGVPDGLVVYVPTAAIPLYQEAAGWKDFIILPIQEDIRNINVSLPAGSKPDDFAQMWLELTNTKSGQRIHYVMTDRETYTFQNIIRNTTWNIALRNERGDVFGRIDNVEVKDEDVSVAFSRLSKPQEVALKVLTPMGEDVTAQTEVTWTDAEGNYVSQGASLSGLPVGYRASYQIVLPQELAMAYNAPAATEYIVKEGGNVATCQLVAIPKVTITGKVKDAETGLPLSDAVVSASQTFGGKYTKTENVKTDRNGVFTIDIANVPTSMAFAATDYVSQTKDCSELLAGKTTVELEEVALKAIDGVTIGLNFSYTESSINAGEVETQNWYSDFQNVGYEVFDVTKNRAISEFSVQYPQIVLLEDVADGSTLRITATSLKNAFMPVVKTVTVAEQKANVNFDIKELGKIRVVFTTTGNAAVVGSLYDAGGKLLKTYNFPSNTLTIDNLADGTYQLVMMGNSPLYNTVYDLAQLPQTGLVEGRDYVQNEVTVRSGVISQVNVNEVPVLNESRLYYTGENTSLTVNKPSIVVGNYLTLTGRIDFKQTYASNVSNVQLVVDIPESCEFVENSVMVGNSTSSYIKNGQQIVIPIAHYTDRVRFCVIPTLGGDYSPSAFVQFDLNGEAITQPIGSTNYTVQNLSISVPSTVAKTTIPISGSAIGTSSVEIYDNDVLIGQTKSLANGTWESTCELNEPYNLSNHSIYAKVTTKNGLELNSETKECKYDKNCIEPKTVTMTFYNGWLKKNVEVVFDFTTGKTSASSYMFYTTTDVTFFIDFTNNDTTLVSNVNLYVRTDRGSELKLPAVYDKKHKKWIAIRQFGSTELPININVDYDLQTNYIGDRDLLDSQIEALSESLKNQKQQVEELDSLSNPTNFEHEDYGTISVLEQLLSNHNYDTEYLMSLLNDFTDGLPVVDDDYNVVTTDDEELSIEYKEWLSSFEKSGSDSLLLDFYIPTDILGFEEPVAPYKYVFTKDNDTYTFIADILTAIDENSLVADGYAQIKMTDGSNVYYLCQENGITFIDSSKRLKYTVLKTNALNSKKKTISDEFAESSLVFSNCLKSAMELMTAIVSKSSYDTWQEKADMLNMVLGNVQCFYESALSWVDGRLSFVLNNKIAETEQKIALRKTEIEKCKTNIAAHTKDLRSIEARNKEIDRLLELYKGSPDYADDINMLLAEKSANNILKEAVDTKILKESKKIINLKGEIKGFRSAQKAFQKAYDIVFKPFSKLPKVLNASTKLGQWTKIGGKLIGGFGVFIETIAFYQDACDALENLNRWKSLKKAIDRKMPCEGDSAKASKLQNDIDHDGKELTDNYARVLWSEFIAIHVDAGSLALWEAPLLELALWFVSGVLKDYAEISKNFSINGKFLNLETMYWQEIGKLKCKKKDNDDDDDDDDDDDYDETRKRFRRWWWPFDPISPIHDPSGYVYEAVASNRVEGVTATIFYKENVEDMYGDLHENIVKWDAAEYAQENPLFTDEYGMYQWDVPQGLWQVKFEKEGYETAYSEWLPVPPPQLDVNIPIKQNRQPEVRMAHAYESAVEMEFDKFMMPELLNTENIMVLQAGKPVEGSIRLLNEEATYEGEAQTYASKVRFNAGKPFTEKEVTLVVSNRVRSYAGIRMQDNFSQAFKVEQEVQQIACDSLVMVDYGGNATISVSILPAAAAKGKVLRISNSSAMLLGVETEQVTLSEEGKAEITVTGELPGMGALTFSLEGIDRTATTLVNVVQQGHRIVATPTASILSGASVEKGTGVTLSCSTEGATIYYTLDGSCPCEDTPSRKVYDGMPIIINNDVTIKVFAVAPGMEDSDVAEFHYLVMTEDIAELTLDGRVKVWPLPVRDRLNVTANGKTIRRVTIATLNGLVAVTADTADKTVAVDVHSLQPGIYIATILTKDGTYSCKILKTE